MAPVLPLPARTEHHQAARNLPLPSPSLATWAGRPGIQIAAHVEREAGSDKCHQENRDT
jgi:hypothetical protein